MIINLSQLLVLLFFFFSLYNCNVYEDIKLKRQGCNYNIDIIIFCQRFLEKTTTNQTPRNSEIQSCLTTIYRMEECKRKLRESDIP